MPLDPNAGHAFVSIDGSFQALSLTSTTRQVRQEVYAQSFGSVGTHTLQLQPNGDARIDLDAIVVLH